MKRLLAILITSLLLTTTVFASFEEDVKNSSQIFAERFSAPTWLFESCKAEGGRSIVLESENYNLTFYSKDISYITQGLRYEFPLETKTKDLYEYNNWVGVNTPKMAVIFAEKTILPGKTYITIKNSSFAPYTSLYVYQRTAAYQYKAITQDIAVDLDRSFTFPVTEGGEYLVSQGSIEDKVVPYDYTIQSVDQTVTNVKKNPSTGAVL